MSETNILRLIVYFTGLVYLMFYIYEKYFIDKSIKKIISYKVAQSQQIVTAIIICTTVIIYLINPKLDYIYIILLFTLSYVYTYIFATLYYKFKTKGG